MIDPDAGIFDLAGVTVVAQTDKGLFGYDLAGTLRFSFTGQTRELQTAGGRIYVRTREGVVKILDAATGTLVGSRTDDLPDLLAGDSKPF